MATKQKATNLNGLSFVPSRESEQLIVDFAKKCVEFHSQQDGFISYLELMDDLYHRTNDKETRTKILKSLADSGDLRKIVEVGIPVVQPQVDAAVAYQASVFLQGYPIFGVVSDNKNLQAAKSFEALISENSERGGWVRQFLLAFNSAFKYNIGALDLDWEIVKYSKLINTPAEAKPYATEEIIWSGNTITALDMYNTFWDLRCPPTEVAAKGEFVGYNKRISRVALNAFINALPNKIYRNIKTAWVSSESDTFKIKTPQFCPDHKLFTVNNSDEFDFIAFLEHKENEKSYSYNNEYVLTKIYARLMPGEFGLPLPNQNHARIFRLYLVNGILIHCEPLDNIHNMLGIVFMQPNEEVGLGLLSQSLAERVQPIQQAATSMVKTILASNRRAVYDRMLYDSSRVTAAQLSSSDPAVRIPVRPSANSTGLESVVKQLPYVDNVSSQAIGHINWLLGFANSISGQNPSRQGQFVKGNKTVHEFDVTMGNSNARDQTCSILLEHQVFTPIKMMLKSNYLQYQQSADVFSSTLKASVAVDPVALRNSVVAFKISDGLAPKDKLISSEALSVAFQTLQAAPDLRSEYRIGELFAYMMASENAHVDDFRKSKEEIAYEQALTAWQQAVAAATESLTKQGADPASVKFPPQPTPDQFGVKPIE